MNVKKEAARMQAEKANAQTDAANAAAEAAENTVKVSELLSKRLICLSTAEILGTVSNIVFDSKMNKGLLLKIYNEDSDEASVCYADFKKVRGLEEDACTVKDKSGVSFEWNCSFSGVYNPMNCECYNQDGKALGRVREIDLQNTKVVSITVDKTRFTPAQLLSFSEQLLIFNDTGRPLKITKPAALKVPSAAEGKTQKVTLHNPAAQVKSAPKAQARALPQPDSAGFYLSENINEQLERVIVDGIAAEQTNSEKNNISLPLKMPPLGHVTPQAPEGGQTPYAFLLGKTVRHEIRSETGGVLIPDKTEITAETISIAKNAGKLVQLALHAD